MNRGSLRPSVMDALRTMAPTLLRFPGSLVSDAYGWRLAVGGPGERSISRALPTPLEMA